MGLFTINNLFLLTSILLRPTEQNPELETSTTPDPDHIEYFGRFCLHVPDDSPLTTSESVTHPQTETPQCSTHAQHTLRSKQTPEQKGVTMVTTVSQTSTGQSEETTQPDTQGPKVVTSDRLFDNFVPLPYINPVDFDPDEIPGDIPALFSVPPAGCRCDELHLKSDDKTTRRKSVILLFPTETCHSYELIETLMDNSQVCVKNKRLLDIIDALSSKESPSEAGDDEKPLVKSSAPPDTTTQFVENRLAATNDYYEYYYDKSTEKMKPEEDLPSPTPKNGVVNGPYKCEICTIMTSLDRMNPNSVHQLKVKQLQTSCPIHVDVSLRDGGGFCLDSTQPQFFDKLRALEKPRPSEDYRDWSIEEIYDGCHCRGRARKGLQENSPVMGAIIWPPHETCSLTQIIETLVDGRQVCVTATSYSEYFSTFRRVESVVPDVPNAQDGLEEENCVECVLNKNWNNIDPQDVKSLEMNVQSHSCPVLVKIHMKRQQYSLCVSSSHPFFRPLLEKLGGPAGSQM